ncbi:MAG: response regulator transcription factor [Actinomycetota bacterium]|nr:response regulator transcription factor [Actinomycetota bacterium]
MTGLLSSLSRRGELIQVAIVDDHPVARRGLQSILADAGDIQVSAAVATPAELSLAGVGAGRPDVIMLDLYHDGDEPCVGAIATLSQDHRVLVVSASGRPADVLGAIRAGACGYVTKLADPPLLVAAVRTVAGGGFALSSQLADILRGALAAVPAATGTAAAAAAGTPALSPREEEALDLIARGLTHAQAASRMGVSRATVDTYVERIRAKLHVGNKAELAQAAIERRPPGGTW